jgi:hypothetical protein
MASLAISWDFAISQNSDGLNIMCGAWLRIVKRKTRPLIAPAQKD